MPIGTPTRIARPNPLSTRLSVAMMLATSARSFSSEGKLPITSRGLGRITGDTRRLSDPSPRVASHHRITSATTAPSPSSQRTFGGGETRSESSGGRDSRGIYLAAGVASAGYTLTSTRRFFAWFSGSDESAGLSQPTPDAAN